MDRRKMKPYRQSVIRELVEREFSVQAIARQTLDLYRELTMPNPSDSRH